MIVCIGCPGTESPVCLCGWVGRCVYNLKYNTFITGLFHH